MAYQLSPGVAWSEIDLTTIVPSQSTTVGGFVGNFSWGPIEEIQMISNELDLISTFGKPNLDNYADFFTASNFLSYSVDLRLVRAANTLAVMNATSGDQGVLIKNKDYYELNYIDLSGGGDYGMFAAKYPGVLGNSLKVSYFASNNSATYATWPYHNEFNGVPSTSGFVGKQGGLLDEMHIIVIDVKGQFSNGRANTVLEKFPFVSKAVDAKNDDGSSNYYVNVLNERSQYVCVMNHAANNTGWGLTEIGRAHV